MRRPSAVPASVGTDLVHVEGLAQRLAGLPGLGEALFTPAERAGAASRAQSAQALAACFAAKEAFLKAVGRGLSPSGVDAWLQQVEVEAGEGPPRLRLHGEAAACLQRRGQHALLSLAADGGHALATVVLVPAAAPAGRVA
ncbi:MAG: 4'-phosphopantetheinyl transferase superfamily protein [Planctomycetia bacterium]